MQHGSGGRNTVALLASAVLAAAYGILMRYVPAVTGGPTVDGAAGVLLGLYTCSHPAANAIDVLFYSRGGLDRITGSGVAWLVLNLAVLLVGWLAIVTGVMRLVH
jgi:hypothetical protein